MVKGYGHALHKEGRYEAGVDVVKSCDWGESLVLGQAGWMEDSPVIWRGWNANF